MEPDAVPLLLSSSNNFVMLGDGEGAVRDARKALASGTTDATIYGNISSSAKQCFATIQAQSPILKRL